MELYTVPIKLLTLIALIKMFKYIFDTQNSYSTGYYQDAKVKFSQPVYKETTVSILSPEVWENLATHHIIYAVHPFVLH